MDLHERYVTSRAVDDDGHVVAEHRRLPPDVAALGEWLHGLRGPVTVAMEATLYWTWLHDQLSAVGIAAVAAHPYQVKLIWQARGVTDCVRHYRSAVAVAGCRGKDLRGNKWGDCGGLRLLVNAHTRLGPKRFQSIRS